MHDFGAGGTDSVTPPARALDAASRLMEGGVIDLDRESAGRIESVDQLMGESAPKFGELPLGTTEEAVIGIQGLWAARDFAQGVDSSQGVASRAEDPALDHLEQERKAGVGETRFKGLKHQAEGHAAIVHGRERSQVSS